MFGNFAEIAKLMGRAKEIQEGIKQMKQELPKLEFSSTALGGQIKVTVSGDLQVKAVEIAPGAGSAPDFAVELQTAINSALFAAKQDAQQRMSAITGGIDLSGLM